MGSSIKINSISIDLAGAANEIDMVKCDHFSIRGYVAETRERDHNQCWPFPEESVVLVDKESYSLPSLSVPKFRWWRCMSCIRDIDTDGEKDCKLHQNSRSLSGKKTQINHSLTIIDQEKEKKTNIAGNNAVEENEDVNYTRSPRATSVRNKVRKLASQEKGRNKRAKVTDINNWKEKHNVGDHGSSEIAGVVEDTPPKAIKNHKDSTLVLMEYNNGSSESINLAAMSGLQRRKTRKVRRLSELLDQPETKTSSGKEESSSSKRGRKRKALPENNYVSRKLITVGAASENDSDQDYSTSSDSGFDRDVIKGKQKNRRFQVVDEFVPSQEGVLNNEADLMSGQRTEKKLKKKKNNGKSTLISFSSHLLNDRFASESYIRKPNDRSVISLHMPENDHVRIEPNRLSEFGSSSKPNTSGWLRTGVDAVVDLSRNKNNIDRLSFQNFNLRNTSCSTEVVDRSSVLQKDAFGSDRKGKTVMFQEHQGEHKRQSHENTHEDQNDDIPMEIVELLAKNQYERCLPDKEEDKQPSQETTHKPKNTLLIDLNETYDNGASLEDNNINNNNNNTSRPLKPCDNNDARREEHIIKSLDFFPISQPYVPSPFKIFPPPPPQENRASSIRWLGNVPTMSTPPQHPYRILRPCNTCQSVPHQYREAPSHPIWASSMRPPQPQCHHHMSVSYNMDPSTKLGMLPQPPLSNDNTWNLNFVAAGKQKSGSSSELSFGCKHGGGVNNSESSIPALHLLSLMDPRVGPNTKRHIPHVNQVKERIEIQTGDSSKTPYQTKQSPYGYYSKSLAPIGPSLGRLHFHFKIHNSLHGFIIKRRKPREKSRFTATMTKGDSSF